MAAEAAATECYTHSRNEGLIPGVGNQRLHKSLQCGITHFYRGVWAGDFLRGARSGHRCDGAPLR